MDNYIDTHVHLWSERKLPPWLSDPSLSSIANERGINQYCSDIGSGLFKGVYVEVNVAPADRAAEAATVVALCEASDNPLAGAVIGAPILDGTVEVFSEYVREWSSRPAVKGVREVMHVAPKGCCLATDVVAKAKLCGELNLVFELCMRADDLADAAELIAQCPETRFVLDHCGGHHQLTKGQPKEKRDKWVQGIETLSKHRNVWCKISGLLGAQTGSDGMNEAWTPEMQHETVFFCLRTFAPDRVLFGGDWPVCTLTAPLAEWTGCVGKLVEGLSVADRAKFLRENAAEVYNL